MRPHFVEPVSNNYRQHKNTQPDFPLRTEQHHRTAVSCNPAAAVGSREAASGVRPHTKALSSGADSAAAANVLP